MTEIDQCIIKSYLETLRNQLIQDIQNGVIKISSGNERLFNRIDEMIELCTAGPNTDNKITDLWMYEWHIRQSTLTKRKIDDVWAFNKSEYTKLKRNNDVLYMVTPEEHFEGHFLYNVSKEFEKYSNALLATQDLIQTDYAKLNEFWRNLNNENK